MFFKILKKIYVPCLIGLGYYELHSFYDTLSHSSPNLDNKFFGTTFSNFLIELKKVTKPKLFASLGSFTILGFCVFCKSIKEPIKKN